MALCFERLREKRTSGDKVKTLKVSRLERGTSGVFRRQQTQCGVRNKRRRNHSFGKKVQTNTRARKSSSAECEAKHAHIKLTKPNLQSKAEMIVGIRCHLFVTHDKLKVLEEDKEKRLGLTTP